MLKGVLLLAMQGIAEETGAIVYSKSALSAQNLRLRFFLDFKCLFQLFQNKFSLIINCT
jgi:hypothetical protein